MSESCEKKTMNQLMGVLVKMQKSTKNSPSSTSKKRRQKSTNRSLSSCKTPLQKPVNHTKITKWFNKENQVEVTMIKRSKTTLTRSASFEKYGVVLPSFEKIQADQQKLDDYKEKLKVFEMFDEDILFKSPPNDCLNMVVPTHVGDILHCKHLTQHELRDFFHKHYAVLEQISKGVKYSKRNNLYRRDQGASDLKLSPSWLVFTQDQIDLLVDLMREQFDREDAKPQYLFKVLLPELCFWIFMDVHEMTKRAATAYLDEHLLDF